MEETREPQKHLTEGGVIATMVEVVAFWPVEHASHARDLGLSLVRSGRLSVKKSRTTVSTPERYFTLSVVCLVVECATRQRKGN